MSSNKQAKKELERIYGRGCFFSRAKLADRIREKGITLTFEKFIENKRYAGKKISHQITYHHLRHKSEGGKVTVENGANVEEIAHQYLHSLPRQQEEVVNNMLRQWKLNYIELNGEQHGSIEFDIDFDDCIELPVFKMKNRGTFNRAKENREFRKRVEEELEEEYR